MNFSQKLGLFILVVISALYIYFSFFHNNDIQHNIQNIKKETSTNNSQPIFNNTTLHNATNELTQEKHYQYVKIFVTDSNGKLRSINRECDSSIIKSCFTYAIQELISAPTKWEKAKGFSSEIPQNTRILSIRESNNGIFIDLSSDFEAGGGTESTYTRVNQLIKTANSNTTVPVYLYINGHQANVIGGDGIMIKQPLSERSLDE